MESDNSQSGNELTIQWDDVLKASQNMAASNTNSTGNDGKTDTNKGGGQGDKTTNNTDNQYTKESFAKQHSTFTLKLQEKDTVIGERDAKILDLQSQLDVLTEENKGKYLDDTGKVDIEKVRKAQAEHIKNSSLLTSSQKNLESERAKLKADRINLEKEKVAFAVHKQFGVPVEELMACKHPLEMISLISTKGNDGGKLPKPPTGAIGGGGDTSTMSSKEKITTGLQERRQNQNK